MGEPVRVHEHPVLGTVAFDPSLYWWQTRSTVPLGDTDQVVVDRVEIYFNDGGLFAEHTIVILLDRELRLTDVKLAG
jgi:hypothetical protein